MFHALLCTFVLSFTLLFYVRAVSVACTPASDCPSSTPCTISFSSLLCSLTFSLHSHSPEPPQLISVLLLSSFSFCYYVHNVMHHTLTGDMFHFLFFKSILLCCSLTRSAVRGCVLEQPDTCVTAVFVISAKPVDTCIKPFSTPAKHYMVSQRVLIAAVQVSLQIHCLQRYCLQSCVLLHCRDDFAVTDAFVSPLIGVQTSAGM